ncbi:hypothetical protein [Klebsiella grimontii]|nr:hypothetical protein [Klebsiella grimontii]
MQPILFFFAFFFTFP